MIDAEHGCAVFNWIHPSGICEECVADMPLCEYYQVKLSFEAQENVLIWKPPCRGCGKQAKRPVFEKDKVKGAWYCHRCERKRRQFQCARCEEWMPVPHHLAKPPTICQQCLKRRRYPVCEKCGRERAEEEGAWTRGFQVHYFS